MRTFLVATLVVGLGFWSGTVVADEAGSWPGQAKVVSHETMMSQVRDFTEVIFHVEGFVPGGVTYFRGWLPNSVFNRQKLEATVEDSTISRKTHCCVNLQRVCPTKPNLPPIKTGIYFHSDGLGDSFENGGQRLVTYIKRHQEPGQQLVAIRRPASFDQLSIQHGKKVDVQAALVAYLNCAFGLTQDESIHLYGHGAETIAVALRVNQERPETVSEVTGHIRTAVQKTERDPYYRSLFAHMRESVAASSYHSPLGIDFSYNHFDEFGEVAVKDFSHWLNGMIYYNGLPFKFHPDKLDHEAGISRHIISDGKVDDGVLTMLREQLLQNQALAREHTGFTPANADVHIGTTPKWMVEKSMEVRGLYGRPPDWIVEQYNGEDPLSEAGFNFILIPAYAHNWKDSTEENQMHIIAHEWWHANMQYHLVNSFCCFDRDRMGHTGPTWLIEGSAEVWAIAKSGALEEDMAGRRRSLQGLLPGDFDIRSLNTRRGWREGDIRYKHDAREVATYMLWKDVGFLGFLDFYGSLGNFYASEATIAKLDSTEVTDQVVDFSIRFFDHQRRLDRLDEIFSDSFGFTMEKFAEKFRKSFTDTL